ncbi:MAG: fused MFS/spermidine synthase [Planctomycetota bacterium]
MRFLAPLLFLSGAAALILEVSWFRRTAQITGGTAIAMGAVLAAVIGGMALGSFWIGRRADRTRNPLRLYGFLELGIALFALLTPPLLSASEGLFTLLLQRLESFPALLPAAQFGLATLILTIPAVLMGGTLPAMATAVRSERRDRGRAIGWLYAINTLGAVAGTLAAGFVLLPALGLSDTMRSAAILSGVAGVLALLLRCRPGAAGEVETWEGDVRAARFAILLYAASGFLGLAAEVAFTRTLVLVFGSSTYAFSTMLAVFLFGIGLGGGIGTRLANRNQLKRLQTTVGITAALFSVSAFGTYLLPRLYLEGFVAVGPDFGPVAFPLAAHLAAAGRTGTGTGRLYAANTLASVAGSTLAVFLLVPSLGPHAAVAVVALGVALLVALASRRRVLALTVLLAAIGLVPPSARAREWLYAGVYFNPAGMVTGDRVNETIWDQGADVPFVQHGREATVSIRRWYGTNSLLINGKAVATNQILADVHHLNLLGHLPMAIHRNPRRVLVVGLGIGTTYQAVERHLPDVLRAVEIEEAVARAAAFLDVRPRDLLVTDARSYIKATSERFDVITADPIHPWVRGGGDLYTLEYFRACKRRLSDEGVVCQWLPVYEMGKRDILDVIRTFTHVFRTALYYGGGDLVLIGMADRDPPLPRRVDLPKSHVVESDLKRLFIAGHARLVEKAGKGPLLTDDSLRLEFSAPRMVRSPESEECMRWIRETWGDPPPPYGSVLSAMEAWARGDGGFVSLMLSKAEEQAPENAFVKRLIGETWLNAADSYLWSGEHRKAELEIQTARRYLGDDPRLQGLQADLHVARGERAAAEAIYRKLLDETPDSTYLRRKLQSVRGKR